MQAYRSLIIGLPAAVALAACSQSGSQGTEGQTAKKQSPQTQQTSAQPATLDVPAGRYMLDKQHSSLHFTVKHLGLSNYVVRFNEYDVKLKLNPDNMAQSSVEVTVDPNSVDPDYSGDYQATHPDVEYDSWPETLAKSDKFFNVGEHPEITYKSTSVEQTGPGLMRVEGALTLLGQTHPVTLNASVSGSSKKHPMSGAPAVGFSASGSFKRSTFGMDHLLNPPLVGDEVTLYFEGEFQKAGGQGNPAGESK